MFLFKRKLVVLTMLLGLGLIFSAQAATAAATDLLISEYIEGSGFNKAIEIYNGTGSDIDLAAAGYTLELYSNGSPTASQTLSLSGTIADGDVLVLANSQADPAILAEADVQNNSVINFNGDDALVLRKNGAVVDAVGQVGVDPGSQWGSGDASTQNNTIRRNDDVCAGDTVETDAFDPATEWAGFPENTFDGLGSHTANCDGGGGGGGSAATDLFFSEYIEGSSFNKAIEIYNGTDGAIDLAAGVYTLELYSNGNAAPNSTLALSGSVAAGDVFVLANPSSDPAILAEADVQNGGTINWNGDDTIVLRKDGAVVDAFGQAGFDPGSQWSSAGVTTQNETLRRNADVCAGDTVETDVFDPAAEWGAFGQDTFDGLGSHTANCDGTPPVTGQPFPFVDGFDNDDCTVAGWQVISVDTDQANTWSCSAQFSNADVNGFGDSAPADEWLITPALDMDAQADETLDFRSWTNFTDVNYPQLEVVYSSDYDGADPTAATWTPLTGITYSPENSGAWTDSGTIDLSGISGSSVYFAFHYVSSGTSGGTAAGWRLDSVEFDVAGVSGPIEAKVHEVQGSGATVALAGQEVTVEAIVIGDYQNDDQLRGFFIQEEDADADLDSATSEGIFVFCGGCDTDVAVGDLVQVTGEAEDFFGMSQLDVPAAASGAVTVVSSGNALPTPATVSFPASASTTAEATFENIEGMLITASNDLVVSEYFQLGRYGQLVLTADARPHQFTDQNAPSTAGYAAFLDDLAKTRIILDDDNNIQNAPIGTTPDSAYYWPRPGLSTSNFVRGGDSISGLSGIMHWSFAGQSGTDAWRIRPVDEAFSYNFVSNNARQAAPDPVGGTFKVASFNVLNYFTTLGERGADSAAELDRQREKIAAAICAIDADVVGLIEIENNGTTAINDLLNGSNGVNAICGNYVAIDAGVIGTDQIAVAFIYRSTTAAPIGSPTILDSSVDPTFIDTKNRPALAQTFKQEPNGGVLTVVVNHLKSKGSSCDDVGDPGLNDGAANCNLTRASAATAIANWLATDPTGSGDEDFLIIGDLNAYRQEDPITNLISAGYVDLLDANIGPDAYSYVFDGQLGYLDYALTNAPLNVQVTGVTAWHINADEINIFDYNDDVQDTGEASFERESGALPVYEANAFRASDHDPVIVGFELDNDQDNDGVADDFDLCSGTVLPEDEPPSSKKNRFFVNENGEFVDGKGNLAGISISDTFGCSGIEIIDAMGLGNGHREQGITRGALLDWIALNS